MNGDTGRGWVHPLPRPLRGPPRALGRPTLGARGRAGLLGALGLLGLTLLLALPGSLASFGGLSRAPIGPPGPPLPLAWATHPARPLSQRGPLSPAGIGPRSTALWTSWNFTAPDQASLGRVAISQQGSLVVAATASSPSRVYVLNGSTGANVSFFTTASMPRFLSIAPGGAANGSTPLLLAGVGGTLEAFQVGSPAFPSPSWTYAANLTGLLGPNGWAQPEAFEANASTYGRNVAFVTTFTDTITGYPGYQLAYLSSTGHTNWTVNVTVGTNVASLAMTPDGSWVAVTTNPLLGLHRANVEVFSARSIWWGNFSTPGTQAFQATDGSISQDGGTLFLAGSSGYYVASAATMSEVGGNQSYGFSSSRAILVDALAQRFEVLTPSTLYGFNTSLFSNPTSAAAYSDPVWQAPLSTPPTLLQAGALDPDRLVAVYDQSVQFLDVLGGSGSYSLPFATAPTAGVAISAAASGDADRVVVGFPYHAGSPSLEVIMAGTPPPPPTFVATTGGATDDGFTVAWGLPGSSVPGFVNFQVQVTGGGSPAVTKFVSDPTATSFTFTTLSPSTTYLVTVRLVTFGGLYAVSSSASATTLAAPVPAADPLAWAPFALLGFLAAGAVGVGLLLLLRSRARRSGGGPLGRASPEERPRPSSSSAGPEKSGGGRKRSSRGSSKRSKDEERHAPGA